MDGAAPPALRLHTSGTLTAQLDTWWEMSLRNEDTSSEISVVCLPWFHSWWQQHLQLWSKGVPNPELCWLGGGSEQKQLPAGFWEGGWAEQSSLMELGCVGAVLVPVSAQSPPVWGNQRGLWTNTGLVWALSMLECSGTIWFLQFFPLDVWGSSVTAVPQGTVAFSLMQKEPGHESETTSALWNFFFPNDVIKCLKYQLEEKTREP